MLKPLFEHLSVAPRPQSAPPADTYPDSGSKCRYSPIERAKSPLNNRSQSVQPEDELDEEVTAPTLLLSNKIMSYAHPRGTFVTRAQKLPYRTLVKQKLHYMDAQLLALIFKKCKFKGLPVAVDSKKLVSTNPKELFTHYISCSKKCEKSTSCEHSLHHSVLNGHFYKDLQKNPRIIIHFFKRCLKCVLFLNTNGIIHSDISPSNIVVKANMPFLVDFEYARAIKLGESDILELKNSNNFMDENVKPKKVHKRDELFTSYLYSDVSGYDLDRQCLGAVFQFILIGTTAFFSQDRQKPVEELLSLNSLDEKKEYLRRNLNPIFKKIKFIDKIIEITAQMCSPVYKLEVKKGKTKKEALKEAKNQVFAKKQLLKKQLRTLVCLDLSTSVSNEHFTQKLSKLKQSKSNNTKNF